jgi:hypothetical protein
MRADEHVHDRREPLRVDPVAEDDVSCPPLGPLLAQLVEGAHDVAKAPGPATSATLLAHLEAERGDEDDDGPGRAGIFTARADDRV